METPRRLRIARACRATVAVLPWLTAALVSLGAPLGAQQAGTGVSIQILEQQPSPGSDADRWNNDYEFRIIEWAQDRIRCEFRERTWQAYLRTAHSGESPKAVAKSLGMSVGAVYVSKARVLKRLKQRIAEIEDDPSWFIN